MPAFDDDLQLIADAAAEGGRIAMRYFGRQPEVWMKDGKSPVSEADYAVDTYLRETLLAARPDYGWLSEETVDGPERLASKRLFVVDPIDGTRGFLEGGSKWCVSIGVVEAGQSIVGALDCPVTGELFTASRGGGARLDGVPITVREMPEGATLEIAGPKPMFNELPPQWRERSHAAGYVPSLAYRVAMIAAGRLDATFIKPNAHDWDLAAAALILAEAGGSVLDASGKSLQFGAESTVHGALAAGSGPLLAAMVSTLSRLDP